MAEITAIPGIGPAVPYITALVAVCAAISMALPPPAAGSKSVYATIYTAINWVALNMGHAKNATAPSSPIPPVAPAAPTTTTPGA